MMIYNSLQAKTYVACNNLVWHFKKYVGADYLYSTPAIISQC